MVVVSMPIGTDIVLILAPFFFAYLVLNPRQKPIGGPYLTEKNFNRIFYVTNLFFLLATIILFPTNALHVAIDLWNLLLNLHVFDLLGNIGVLLTIYVMGSTFVMIPIVLINTIYCAFTGQFKN